jgi:acetylornithine deacetylase/succinyl-diaminopimelate desuccinylase-like protein
MPQNPVQLLQTLIRIPSVNPDDASGSSASGEADIANALAEWLSSSPCEVVLEEVLPGRPNLIARFAPLDGRPRILLGPHLDTVGVDHMTIDPFGGEVRDGKIWGRGASDTKGSMAAMLWALAENIEILQHMPFAVDFVAFMGEESGQWGSKHFAKHHGKDYAFAICGEPTDLNVVHVTKGSLWATLEARGKAAHSSMPEKGENAVTKLALSLLQLEEALLPILGQFSHPVLGNCTCNIGTFRGGSRPNIVPDLASAQLDIRVTPGLYAQGGGLAALHHVLKQLALPVSITYSHENPPMETPKEHPMVQLLMMSGVDSQAVGAPWFSDAAHLSAAGIPSVCLGPGSIAQAHTADEFLKIDDLLAGVDHFSRFIRMLAK